MRLPIKEFDDKVRSGEITNAEMTREELHFNPKYNSMSEWYGTIIRDDAAE